MQIVDLSVVVNEQTPAYPGDPTVAIKQLSTLEKDGFIDHYVSIDTHAGTHIDAPYHMLAGGKKLSEFPIEKFIGRGRYVKVDDTFDLATLRQMDIQKDDIVLFHTGMSDNFYEPIYYEKHPVMSEEIAHYLVEKKVKIVGLDTGSADMAEDFPVHKILLGGEVLIIENLTNLAPLAGHSFIVHALPIKLELDGAPARVIAEIV